MFKVPVLQGSRLGLQARAQVLGSRPGLRYWAPGPGSGTGLQGSVSLTATDCPTGRQTILLWTNNMGGWSVARSDGPSLLVKQAPGLLSPIQGTRTFTSDWCVILDHQTPGLLSRPGDRDLYLRLVCCSGPPDSRPSLPSRGQGPSPQIGVLFWTTGLQAFSPVQGTGTFTSDWCVVLDHRTPGLLSRPGDTDLHLRLVCCSGPLDSRPSPPSRRQGPSPQIGVLFWTTRLQAFSPVQGTGTFTSDWCVVLDHWTPGLLSRPGDRDLYLRLVCCSRPPDSRPSPPYRGQGPSPQIGVLFWTNCRKLSRIKYTLGYWY